VQIPFTSPKDDILADVAAPLRDALRDRYALERELGRGGMATVYLVRDVKHKRLVALKVLHPELAAALGSERFQREIEFAARLQHPHILTVLDSGEAAGQLWFTMPYVEGESLRSRLRRERQLPVDEALRIATETARALDYAHRQGVMHRDIKPENILLTKDGDTLVADFGIARALAGSDERLTETGMSVGTPAYMSPEQASGDKAVDARTDVYSLGCVLYELLAGEPPYTGPTAQVIIMKRFTEPVPSVRKVRPSVPEAVDQAIQRALAPIPADRFAASREFARALQPTASGATAAAAAPTAVPSASGTAASTTFAAPATAAPSVTTAVPTVPLTRRPRLPIAAITLGLGFFIGLGVLFAWRRSHATPEAESTGAKRLAVLPFENLGDSADAYFADGMTDEVRGKLSHVAGVAVIARASSNDYRKTTKAPQQIARELGADYLLTATVRWEKAAGGPSRVRVSPELIRVEPGAAPTTKWQQGFDASLTDVFQVQADIATKVASALDVALGDSARHQLAAKPTANLAAYDAFLKGEAVVQASGVSDPASLRRAIALYEQAVTLDPAFVPAWAQLARCRAFLYGNSTPNPDLAAQARQAAERAQALGPDQPEPKQALGDYYATVLVDNQQALAAYEAGLKLTPNNVDLLGGVSLAEQGLGRWEASLPRFAKASQLDPRSAPTQRRMAQTLLYLRRYPEAEAPMDRALALAPTNFDNILRKVMLTLAQGDLSGAQAFVRKTLSTVEPTSLIAFLAIYQDLYWVLDDAQQQQLLTFPLSAFDNDPGTLAIVRAQTYHLRGNQVLARIYADSAQLALEEQLRAAPEDGQRHVFRGLALAYLGRKAEAIAEGKRGVALWPISRDASNGAYVQHQLVRIYLLVGEPEKALDQLEPLLKMPYYLSPGWLRIDPTFAPLKGNPRFERLVAAK
jgi:TolB-like protein/tRNA A-37 threonylcarbamoyl transferase component Bud32/Tfp pilus assembly protein PilF